MANHSPRILIIDDNAENVFIVRRFLETAGYEQILVEHDSRNGLDQVRQFQPDVVLLDMHMPHVTGMELLAGLRAEGHSFPVIVISASAPPEVRARAAEYAPTEFFESYDDMKQLTAMVQRMTAGSE
jgi:CheY-like chemotaxis protein